MDNTYQEERRDWNDWKIFVQYEVDIIGLKLKLVNWIRLTL